MSWDSQSVSLPGSTATPEPFRFSTTLPAFWRAVAALMASCAIFLASSTLALSHASSGSFTREAMSFTASRDERRSLVCPWNCGSRMRAERTKRSGFHASSDCRLTPRVVSSWCSQNSLIDS